MIDDQIDIVVLSDLWQAISNAETLVRDAAKIVYEAEADAFPDGWDVAIALTDNAHIQLLNAQFRGKDKPTNVLSFPGPEEGAFLGDIAIAYETVATEADAEGKSMAHHLTHLTIHGMLHLLGYDHESEEEAEEMEALEIKLLASMGIADPYA